ncbi:MAG: VCBS repeat-containing protein [Nitrospinaceae bacterium]|nr:VCBS repeat-containing protein [Nitrospinaceae bacterium]
MTGIRYNRSMPSSAIVRTLSSEFKIASSLKIFLGFIMALLLVACDQNEPAPDLFSLPTNYAVGKKPAELKARDMNLDGFPDILVCNSGSDTLSYFEATGDGTFKQPFTMNTGREPVALEVGDFDGDEIPDIAISNYGDGEISIVLGQKDGVFKLKSNVKVGRLPIAVAAGDFNNDEKLDLAVTLRFDKLVILLGVGDGTFKPGEIYKASGTPAYMTVGDFNYDKNIDLAVAFNAVRVNFIRIFYGNGDGTLKNPVTVKGGKQSSFITQYDINNDGKKDLLTSSTMNDVIKLFLNNGRGEFTSAEDAAAEKGPQYIVPGDFTGDRIPDLAIANRRDASISILQGRGDGTFIFPHFNYPVGASPRAMIGEDFNDDGLTDLALLLYDSQRLEVILRKITSPIQIDS